MKGHDVLFSKDIQTYSTPPELFDWVDSVFHFTLDACADKSNHKCAKYYNEETNGLLQSWKDETVWINPPYKFTKDWVLKAIDEVYNNECKGVVLLIPARTETILFHEIIDGCFGIVFLKRRIKFSGNKNGAPFPSALIILTNRSILNRSPVVFLDNKVDKLSDYVDKLI
jgi:site-specific DNA-methyltransferase (adenine-specific)